MLDSSLIMLDPRSIYLPAFAFLRSTGLGAGQDNRLAAGLLDLFQRRPAEAMGRDLQLLRQLAVAEHFQLVARTLAQPGFAERFQGYFVARLECRFQIADIDDAPPLGPTGC